MKGIINFIAVCGQLIVLVYSAATYGFDVGLWVFVAIMLNAIQAATKQ